MAETAELLEWQVTAEKVDELIRRIVAHANPLQIIAFGSRARGDHRDDSDLDIAVILDGDEIGVYKQVPYTLLRGITMEVDMIVATKAKYDLHRPWLNSVYNYIDQEGVVLYDREHPQRASPQALHLGSGRFVSPSVSAA